MASLNPDTNFNVAAERPVVDDSASSIFDLANAALKSFADQGTIKPEDDPGLNAAVIDGMKRIRAARREGKTDLARRLELNMLTEYTKAGGDVNDGKFQQLALSITGRDVDEFSFSDEELQMEALKDSPEYQSALTATLITHPDASADEREAIALSSIAAREGRKAILAQADYNFTVETAGAITSEIDDFTKTIFGAVAAAGQQGAIITLEQADAAILRWEQEKQQLTRPANVSAEAWAPVQERIEATDSLFAAFRKIIEPGNVEAQALSNLYAGIKAAGFPNQDMLITALSADPEVLLNFGVLPVDELTSALKSLDTTNGGHSAGSVRDPSIQDPIIPEFSGNETRTPEELFTVAWDSLKVANAHGDTVANNADVRENWAGIVARGVDHLAYLTSQGEFVSEDAINGMFNDAFFKKLQQVQQADPELGEALLQRTNRALTMAGLAADRQYRTLKERSAFDYDVNTNTFQINRGTIRRALAGETGDQALADKLIEAIDDVYGGDYEALMADRGNAFLQIEGAEGRQVFSLWNRITENGQPPEQLRTISNSIYGITQNQKKLVGASTSNLDPNNNTKSGNVQMPAEVKNDAEFHTAVVNTSARLGMNPNDLMRAIHFETAGTFRPDIKNPGSTATGLIQFLEGTAGDLGTTTKQLAGMSRAEQMAYVENYLGEKFKAYGITNPSFADIYTAIHYPAALNKDDNFVLYSKNGDQQSRKSYRANASLDSNGDGTVTKGEAWQNAWARSGGGAAKVNTGIVTGDNVNTAAEAPPQVEVSSLSAPFQSSRPVARPSSTETQETAGEPQVQVDRQASRLSTNTQRLLTRMQIDPNNLAYFNSSSEVDAAADAGQLNKGDMFVLNGQLVRYDG